MNSYYRDSYLDYRYNDSCDVLVIPELFNNSISPCSYIRIINPIVNYSANKIFDIRIGSVEDIYKINYKLIILNRVVDLDYSNLLLFINFLKNNNKLLIYDIDDELFSINKSHEDYSLYYNNNNKIRLLLENADIVTTSEEALAENILQYNKKIIVIKNDYILETFIKNYSSVKLFNIMYMGTYTHDEDLKIAIEAMKELYLLGYKIKFNIIGGTLNLPNCNWISRISIPEYLNSYPKFIDYFRGIKGMDLGIAPLIDNKFNNSKSTIKVWDYLSSGIPTLASDVKPYNKLIIDGVNGLLVANTKSKWVDKLIWAIENKEIMYKFCENLYNNFNKMNNLVDVIKSVLNNKDIKYSSNEFTDIRKILSKKYLYGSGLEIGALHNPLWIDAGVIVKYVDRMDKQSLYGHYPELIGANLVEVDVIDDGESLDSVGDNSLDFVIANHFLEHSEDPILTIKNMLRVIRNGGIIYLSIPNMQKTFDVNRELTTLDHLISDHRYGAVSSRKIHCEEWARFVEPHFGRIYSEETIYFRVDELQKQKYSIHFHCWTPESFKEFLNYLSTDLINLFAIEEMQENNDEFICIIRKGGA